MNVCGGVSQECSQVAPSLIKGESVCSFDSKSLQYSEGRFLRIKIPILGHGGESRSGGRKVGLKGVTVPPLRDTQYGTGRGPRVSSVQPVSSPDRQSKCNPFNKGEDRSSKT